MTKTPLFLSFFALMTSNIVFAKDTEMTGTFVEVVTGQGIDLQVLNGRNSDELSKPLMLLDKINQLVVRVDQTVGRGDNRSHFTSAPYIIDFEIDGTGELLVAIPSAATLDVAEKLFSQASIDWIVTFNGKPIEYNQYKLPGKKGMFPYSNLLQQVEKYNATQGIRFVDGQRVTLENEVYPTLSSSEGDSSSQSKILKAQKAYLYLSESERHSFKVWLNDQ